MLPTAGKFLVLGLLGMGWMLLCRRAMQMDTSRPYHVAAYQRDRKKARFYYQSVWVGLVIAFFSFLSLEAIANVTFESRVERDWVFNVLRGAGLWGLMLIALVWSQVGQRVSAANSDGKSLLPAPEPKQNDR